MKSSKIIFFTLIFHLTISTIAFLELKRNDNFFIDSLNPNNISLINEFRICFKDLMFNPKVIVFKDEVVPNLNDVFNMSSFTLKQLPDEKVYSIDVTFFEKQLILKSKFFNLLNKSSINCIYFKSIQPN